MRGGPNRKLDVLAALPGPEIARTTRRGQRGTVSLLSALVGISEVNVRKHLRQLYTEGKAYIACWNRSEGPFVPVWVKGKGQHAPKPQPMSMAQNSMRFRARVRKAIERSKRGFKYDERYAGRVALAMANEVAAKARVNPQHWFSPLGL